MTVRAQDAIHASEASGLALTRRECELRELVDELQSQRAELVERGRIHDLEVVSQRRELEVRFAFEATLEERLLEYQHQIEWLHGHVEIEVQRRFAAELTAKSEHVAEALRERDEVRRELDAERRRISYRAVQSVIVQVKKRRVFFAMLRRTARVVRGPLTPTR